MYNNFNRENIIVANLTYVIGLITVTQGKLCVDAELKRA
jgi:hypothetical protein